MLRSLFAGWGNSAYIALILLRIPCVLLSLCVHESAHGKAAEKLGDPTARCMGRISLNPLRHFDPIGTICMVLFGFGWAKPVPVNAGNFKNPKRDMALTALAGPASNLGLACIGAVLYHLLKVFYIAIGWLYMKDGTLYLTASSALLCNFTQYSLMLFDVFCSLNIGLAIFNFIPVPPLDGSRICLLFLPERIYFGIMRYERYIMLALLVLLWLGLLDAPLSFLTGAVYDGIMWLTGLLPNALARLL